MTESPVTAWRSVVVLILAGVIGAFQVGKAAVAVPLLRQDLGASVLLAALIVSSYATLGAIAGLPAGAAVTRLGARRAIIAGLLAIGAGSGLGAFAGSGTMLLATRVIEGCGFLGIVVAAPALVRTLAAPRDRELALALWGVYMPAGSAIMMLGGPVVAVLGWQALWIANSAMALCYAAVVWLCLAPVDEPRPSGGASLQGGVARVLSSPGSVLAALIFGLYTFQYFALTGLMPLLLVERLGLTVAQAGLLSAATVVANAFGNLAAGVALRLGVPLWTIVAAAFSFMAVASLGIFADGAPVALVATLASASLAVTGLIPASIFAASPRLAPAAPLLGVTLGLLIQASNIGQFAGPAVLGFWAETFGWSTAAALFVAIAFAGIFVALRLRALLRAAPAA